MFRIATVAALVLVAWLTGCATSRPPLPVVETGVAAPPVPGPAAQLPLLAPVPEPSPAVPPPQRVPAALPPSGKYLVRPGDTLYAIALRHRLDYRLLAEWNGLDDPGHIVAGETLSLTPPSGEVALAPTPDGHAAAPAAPSRAAPGAERRGEGWTWPAMGKIWNCVGEAAGMHGIDIAGSRGSPVRAVTGGRVVYAGAGLRGYGKLIIIKHSNNILTAYGHIDTILVKEGQTVARSQVIARMGDTDAEQVKLHFEVRERGTPVDPMQYLPARG